MALDAKVADVLNTQINKELYSAYLYLTFADYYEDRGLKGFANWYMIQVEEEVSHAKILRRYCLDNGFTPKMLQIDEPDKTFADDMAPLKAGYEHEQYVTSLIHHCFEVAQEAHDIRTMQMLDWFVKEQGERDDQEHGALRYEPAGPLPARPRVRHARLHGADLHADVVPTSRRPYA